jgi:hypothetical protein
MIEYECDKCGGYAAELYRMQHNRKYPPEEKWDEYCKKCWRKHNLRKRVAKAKKLLKAVGVLG